jgi:hypothetical protein
VEPGLDRRRFAARYSPDPTLPAKIVARLEKEGDRISDLHLWRLGPGHIAARAVIVTQQ